MQFNNEDYVVSTENGASAKHTNTKSKDSRELTSKSPAGQVF